MAELGAPDENMGSRSPASNRPPSSSPGLGVFGRLVWVLVYLLPKNAISRWAGRLASWQLPGPVQRAEIRLFARITGIDLEEAAETVDAYPSLQKFFTRSLRAGVRPIHGDAETLNAPCDGRWGASGPIDAGVLVQVKGRRYRVRDLLDDIEAADAYEGGFFATFYLSPRDYHRLHTPTAGRIQRLGYCPGELWPVNAVGLHGVDRLFARNERICAYLEPDGAVEPDRAYEVVGETSSLVAPTAIAMVAVGATMVGSVKLVFDELTTNRGQPPERRDLGKKAPHFERGAEWGRFEFGSTLVMLIPPESFELNTKSPGTPLRLGEAIGRRIR